MENKKNEINNPNDHIFLFIKIAEIFTFGLNKIIQTVTNIWHNNFVCIKFALKQMCGF